MSQPRRVALDQGPVTQTDITSWQSKLRRVVLETVDEKAVQEILEAIIAKAKEGNLQAARLVLAYAVGAPAQAAADARCPTSARAGSKSKLDVLAYRAAHGVELHANGDGGEVDLS